MSNQWATEMALPGTWFGGHFSFRSSIGSASSSNSGTIGGFPRLFPLKIKLMALATEFGDRSDRAAGAEKKV